MGLKISKQAFFKAYSDPILSRPIYSRGNRVEVGTPKEFPKKTFSLSHKLYDARHLIARENNSDDRKRLFQIVDRIYLEEHYNHHCFVQLVIMIKNILAGRGFVSEKSLYDEIKGLRKHEVKNVKEIAKGAVKSENLLKDENPFSQNFEENFARLIQPLSAEEIKNRVLAKKPPFDRFYADPEEGFEKTFNTRMVYVYQHLNLEQQQALQKALFVEKEALTSKVLINFIISINYDKKIIDDLITDFANRKFLPIRHWLYRGRSDLFRKVSENPSSLAVKHFVHAYLRFALVQPKTVALNLLNDIYFHERTLTERVLEECDLDLPKLKKEQQEQFLDWARGKSLIKENILPKISPAFQDMSIRRAKDLVLYSPNKIETLRNICTYLDEKITPGYYDTSNFCTNLNAVMPLFNRSEIADIVEKDIFKFNEDRCAEIKIGIIFESLEENQVLALITHYKMKTKNLFITLFNLVSHFNEKVKSDVIKTYGNQFGPCFAECPKECLILDENDCTYLPFQIFLYQFVKETLQGKDFSLLDLLYKNNLELFKFAIKGDKREDFKEWENGDSEKQNVLDSVFSQD